MTYHHLPAIVVRSQPIGEREQLLTLLTSQAVLQNRLLRVYLKFKGAFTAPPVFGHIECLLHESPSGALRLQQWALVEAHAPLRHSLEALLTAEQIAAHLISCTGIGSGLEREGFSLFELFSEALLLLPSAKATSALQIAFLLRLAYHEGLIDTGGYREGNFSQEEMSWLFELQSAPFERVAELSVPIAAAEKFKSFAKSLF